MKAKLWFLGLVAALVASGAWMPVFGQTGDCYSQYPGCLDVSFGVNGRVTLPPGMIVSGLAVQAIGGEERIVAAGHIPGTRRVPGPWVLVRYRPDGTLDTTFGSGGIVKYTPSKGVAGIQGIAVQPDQKVVVAGVAAPLSKPNMMNTLPTIARYNTDGSIDTTFGTSGLVQIRCLVDSRIGGDSFAVVVQSDLKIAALTYFAAHLGVCRLNPNGTLDTSFNGSGRYFETRRSCAFGIATQWIDSEERIVVSGNIDGSPSSLQKAVLIRFTGSGALDPSFGEAGYAIGDHAPSNDGYGRMAIDGSNRIVVTWLGDDFNLNMEYYAIMRHLSDGSLDVGFGDGGKVISQPTGAASLVEIQPGEIEKILAAGDFEGYHAFWRYLVSGTADMTFGSSGWVTTELEGPGGVAAMAQQSDSKFVVAAGTRLYRYWK